MNGLTSVLVPGKVVKFKLIYTFNPYKYGSFEVWSHDLLIISNRHLNY